MKRLFDAFDRAVAPLGLDGVCAGCGGGAGSGVLVVRAGVPIAACALCGEALGADGRCARSRSGELSVVVVHAPLADAPGLETP